MSEKYKIRDQEQLYFVTYAVVQWIDVFTRMEYYDLIVSNLKYCQENKGLEIYGWCIMTNHIHLIVGREGTNKIEDIIRDFKKYTSVKLIESISSSQLESRKEWMLWMFKKLAERSTKHQKYSFWQDQYHPIQLSDNHIMQQKLDYIHDNPVKAGFVSEPHHYRYSSAIDYSGGKGLIDIKFIG